MEKNKLDKIFLRYSGAAAALLGANAVNGQVIWQDINDVVLNTNGAYYDLNLTNDTINDTVIDFRITQYIDTTNAHITSVKIEAEGTATNEVMGFAYGNYNYPFRLNVGDSITAGKSFKGVGNNGGYLAFIDGQGTLYPNSQFVDTANGITNGFIGLRFQADLNDTIRTFYGWVVLDISDDLKTTTIKEFAYQAIPDVGLRAGDGSPLSLEEPKVDYPNIAQRGLNLDVTLPGDFRPKAEIEFVDLSGRVFATRKMHSREETFSLADLPKGIHIAIVRSNGKEASRKIVVY